MIRKNYKFFKWIFIAICMAVFLAIPGVYVCASEVGQIDSNTQSVYNFMQFNRVFTQTQLRNNEQITVVTYPDDYAGAYIDDNDILHINYVDNGINEVKDIMKDTNIIYDSVDFSYNLLEEIFNTLGSNMQEYFIRSMYIDEINNNVNISTSEDQQEKIIQFLERKILDFSPETIVFSPIVESEFTESGGSTIGTNSNTFTLGYNAYQSSTKKYGFVTCGHSIDVGSEIMNLTTTVLGTVTKRSLGGKIDAAFVPYNTQSKKTTASLTGYDITGTFTSSEIVVGANVTKYGIESGLTQGKVTSKSANTSVGSYSFTDQVKVSITQVMGDSGGPVVFNFAGPIQPGQERESTLIGIATIADGGSAYVTKAANINSSFGITTYTK